jgi:hypothetical protein
MNTKDNDLLPFTRLVLVVSAAVQLIFGLAHLLFTNLLWNGFFWTAPLPAWPVEAARFSAMNYLATAIAALYALNQGKWSGAKVYFAYSFPYVVLSVIAALVTAANPGVPAIMWLYVLLSAIYLPVVAYTWLRQERSGTQVPGRSRAARA